MTRTSTSTPLEPTARTTVNRGRNRAVADREELHAFLADITEQRATRLQTPSHIG
mgnify:CR=1 FL=1